MKLISLKLCNFRQFYGKTPTLKIASGDRNTTIIYGSNGAGKTTLLNAFTWVLYEQFTAAFASSESLVNKRAIAEASPNKSVEFWVELEFSHEYKRYQLKRKGYATKKESNTIEYSQAKLFMLVAGDDGRWYPPIEDSEEAIARILPASLHQYFFFDGERIDSFFRGENNHHIAEDTKELLGVKVLDRAIDHLKKAKKNLQEELQAIGDLATKTILKAQLELEQKRDALQLRQKEIVQNLENLDEQKQAIAQQILELSGANRLQQLKEKLLKQERLARKNLLDSKQNLKQLIARQGYLIFLSDSLAKFADLVNNLRTSDRLSSGIRQDFVQNLLEQQKCLCDRQLQPGTNPFQKVESWLKKAEDSPLEAITIRLETRTERCDRELEKFWQEIDREQQQIQSLRTEIAKLENDLDNINKQLRTYPDRNIQKLQKQVEFIEERVRELILEQGANQQQLKIYRRDLEQLVKEIQQHQLQEAKQTLAKRRIQATQDSIERLIEVRVRLEQQFRATLEQKVRAIFNSISYTPYQPKLGTNYELTLVEQISGKEIPVAASTGENQILSLSFIGGIIERVREWSQHNNLIGPDSSTFPIVMDSPFGSLDEIYRRQVAKAIPRLANQLIILVTKTQWRGEVETEVAEYIGKEYILVYNSPKADCEIDWLKLDGISYPLVKLSSDGFEHTEIIEVERGDRRF